MKRSTIAKFLTIFTLTNSGIFAAIPPEAITKQSYTHKFGAVVSKEEWDSRGKTGQIISTQANGITITQNIYKGVQQGETTYTFPKSSIIQKVEIYEDGQLKSTIFNYPSGIHSQKIEPVTPTLIQITTWFEKGSPRSIEEVEGSLVANGIYYTPLNEEESRVVQGYGIRTNRDSKGVFLSKDTIQNGLIVLRTTYHPNGEPFSLTTFNNGIVHGTHKIYDTGGQPKEIQEWVNGKQHGTTTVFENGERTAEIPYSRGVKHGTERQFQGQTVLQEISWLNGLKHGASKQYSPEDTQVQWYLLGQPVTGPKKIPSSMPALPVSQPYNY